MNKRPAFQFYPKDWISDPNVRSMTKTQRGIYIDLLCYCWLQGSIPKDIRSLARLCEEKVPAMRRHWVGIACCFQEVEGRLVNPRLQLEREKQTAFSEAMKKAASRRWSKEREEDAEAMPTHMPMHCLPNALQSPVSLDRLKSQSDFSTVQKTLTDGHLTEFNWQSLNHLAMRLRDGIPRSKVGHVLTEFLSGFREGMPGGDFLVTEFQRLVEKINRARNIRSPLHYAIGAVKQYHVERPKECRA